MEKTTQIKLSKKTQIIVGIIVLGAGIGLFIAQKNGANLHVNSSVGTNGKNYTATEHLDGQVDVSGTVQAVYKNGSVMVVAVDNVAIDLSPALASPNASAFLRGDVKSGAHFKAVLQKTDSINAGTLPPRPTGAQQITQFYQLVPSAPYYFEITP